MRRKWVNRTFALALVMVFALVGCANGEGNSVSVPAKDSSVAPEREQEAAGFTVADNDEDIYMNNLGEFYEAYQLAMAAGSVAETHALLAVAEAKALEAAGGTPMYGPPASYEMTRLVYCSGGYADWRGRMNDRTQYVITNEIITAEDNAHLQSLRGELLGTGTYVEKAKEYLAGKGYTFADTIKSTFSDNPTTWDIFAGTTGTDGAVTAPTYDYLFVYDAEGKMVPHLATGYEISDDGLVYTIHIREGLTWVDSQGRKIADLVADDWVAAAQHMADVNNCSLLNLYVAGVTEYLAGETTDFSTVGIKALDDHTLQYTLREPATYFVSLFQRSQFIPMSRSYFLSQGGVFGVAEYAEASAAPSYTYGISQNNIAYCGPYLCVNMTERNSVNYVLNESYWNASNMAIQTLTFVYDDGADVSREYSDFMNGDSIAMYLRAATLEQAQANGDFEKYAVPTDTGRATFLYWFNLHRQTYANVADGAAPSQKTDAEKELSEAAFQNRHFRLAIAHSIDRATFIAQNVGENLKYLSIRNTITPGTYVNLAEDVTIDINGEATTFPAGTWYGAIVQAQLDADGFPVKVWDGEKNTSDGWDAWYNPEMAAAELSIAIDELAALGYEVSAENPIVIDFPHAAYVEMNQNQAIVLKTTIENALGGLVRFDVLDANDSTEWMNVVNNVSNGSEINTDMGSLYTIGSDHGDPRCYLEGLLPYGDGGLTEAMGLW